MDIISLQKSLLIVVASQNPVKINAVKQAFLTVFPESNIEVKGVSIPSGVSDQPMNDKETYQGAFNRCQGAQQKIDADFWVGIEGGIDQKFNQVEAFAWMVIQHKSGKGGQSRSASFALPTEVVALVNQGIELGEANDRVFRKIESKKKGGAVGLLTKSLIDRTALYKHAIILALIPFIQEELYGEV